MIARVLAGLAALGAAAPAFAQDDDGARDLFSGDQLRGFLDFRVGAADGESSWVEGGFGKTAFGGDDGGWEAGAHAHASLVWRPHLTWALNGYLHLQADPRQDNAVDVVEAFVSYRPMPIEGVRVSGRAGLMYPPVSLEHDGPAWSTTVTLTPSAINTWIGEEVLVVGAEATARGDLLGQEVGATLGLFGYNDTSGTLLSYRGWALHDNLATAFGDFPLPDRSVAWRTLKASQSMTTEPVRELDDRAGYYVRLDWRPIGPVLIDVLHYDNAGDRLGYQDGQWSWETRFTNVGVRARLTDDTRLLAQAMTGQTVYGRRTPGGYWVDMDFSSAYALVAHEIGETTLAARLEYFATRDKSNTGLDNNDEDGWAATAAYTIALPNGAELALEGVHVQSNRPSRADVGGAPEQRQTTLQAALQLAF